MNELIEWFEDRFDPDEIPDVLDLTMEDLIRGFEDRAREYQLHCEGEETTPEQEGL